MSRCVFCLVTGYMRKSGHIAHHFHPGNDYLLKEMQAEHDVCLACVGEGVRNWEAEEKSGPRAVLPGETGENSRLREV